MLTLTLVEDQTHEQHHWNKLIEKWSHQNSIPITTYIYSSAEEFLNTKERWSNSQIIFLDIELPEMNGIELARKLREEKILTEFVFLTAHHEYVFDGYSVEAFDYLLKPLNPDILNRCLDRIFCKYRSGFYTYRTSNMIVQIPYQDILYFTTYHHCTEIVTNTQTYTQRINMNNVLRILPAQFIQIHRTTIINIHHVYSLIGNTIIMNNQQDLPVSRPYLKNLKTELVRYTFL